jgi:DNA (cytosine-5)-methyltransferase 1
MKTLSLFSGCGGLDLGFSDIGFEIVGSFDADRRAVETYNSHFKHKSEVLELNSETSFEVEADVVLAGPPCQGFSTATGYPREDSRNGLLLTACRIAVKSKPKVIVLENVSGLLNARNFSYLQESIAFLNTSGYHVETKLVHCERFGIAQRRRRLFIVARSQNRQFNFDLDQFESCGLTISDAFNGLTPNQNSHDPRYVDPCSLHAKIIESMRPGQKLCNVRAGHRCVHTWDIPSVFGSVTELERKVLLVIQRTRRAVRRRDFGDADPVLPSVVNQIIGHDVSEVITTLLEKQHLRQIGEFVDMRHTYNGKYRRLELDAVSPTVDTHFGNLRLFVHPNETRGMTVREAARLQGFPDEFGLPRSRADAFKQVGNAVPPPVARCIAKFARTLV